MPGSQAVTVAGSPGGIPSRSKDACSSFAPVGSSDDPVVMRSVLHDGRRYFYAVNRDYYPVKLDIDSPARPEATAALVAHAERACHAAQSLRHPIPVTLAATLNGVALE